MKSTLTCKSCKRYGICMERSRMIHCTDFKKKGREQSGQGNYHNKETNQDARSADS